VPREIRTLKRAFFTDEKITAVPREVRLTFLGLVVNADDYGRLRSDPRLLKAAIYPLDDSVTAQVVAGEIDELERIRVVRRYEVAGVGYLEIGNFAKHQVMNRKYGSDIPEPAEDVPTQCAESAYAVRAHGRSGANDNANANVGAERSSEPVAGTIVPAPIPALRPGELPEDDELPASLLGLLPPEATDLLSRFYEPALTPAARKRYRDVAVQLIDAVDPKHAGPKIRGGMRVKARSREHMADVCRSVIQDPPNNRDAAIVFVLQKLTDPPKGPSVTEQAARAAESARQREDAYEREAKRAGVAWAKDHPDEFERIRATVEATYQGKSGSFVEQAKQSELVTRTARAADFPKYDDWLSTQRQSA
jgi:hypothetical protein